MDRERLKTPRGRNAGTVQAWLLFFLVAAVVTTLVVIFIRHLPDPPRYAPLTIDPGSEVPSRPAFGMRLELGEGDSLVTRSWRAVDLEVIGKPSLPEVLARGLEVGDAWRLVAGLNLELSETTILGLLIEVGDVEFVIRSGLSEIASDRVDEVELRRIDDFLVPAGSRLLEFDILPIGPNPVFRGSWIDESEEQRPLGQPTGPGKDQAS